MSKNSGELQVHKNMEAWDKYVRTRDLDALVSWAQAEGYPANDTGLVSLPEIAVENGDLNALDRLIKLGYDVNLVTDTGFSLLHNAISERAQAKDVAVVTYLMEHGARLDAMDVNNQTPVERAVLLERWDLAYVLAAFKRRWYELELKAMDEAANRAGKPL